MKSKVYDIKGKEKALIELPLQFKEKVNPNLIKRAVLAVQSTKYQPQGTLKEAGKRSSAKLSRRRHDYRGAYGHGVSRVPRKIMWRRGTQFGWEGANAPGTKGGRKAHPPKQEKNLIKKINKKERRKAIRSAMSATIIPDLIKIRHKIPKNYPLIVESKFELFNKSKQVLDLLKNLGLQAELERISVKKIRAGKGKSRGRKYKTKVGPLIVVARDCPLEKAARNLQGLDIVNIKSLNVELLAPGTVPGRLTIWSEDAVNALQKLKLYTNRILKEEK